MAIHLDHIIVPSRSPVDGATFLAGLLGAPWAEAQAAVSPVPVELVVTCFFAS